MVGKMDKIKEDREVFTVQVFPCGSFHAAAQGDEVLGWHHVPRCLLGRSWMLHVCKAMHVHKNVYTQKLCDASVMP